MPRGCSQRAVRPPPFWPHSPVAPLRKLSPHGGLVADAAPQAADRPRARAAQLPALPTLRLPSGQISLIRSPSTSSTQPNSPSSLLSRHFHHPGAPPSLLLEPVPQPLPAHPLLPDPRAPPSPDPLPDLCSPDPPKNPAPEPPSSTFAYLTGIAARPGRSRRRRPRGDVARAVPKRAGRTPRSLHALPMPMPIPIPIPTPSPETASGDGRRRRAPSLRPAGPTRQDADSRPAGQASWARQEGH
jgi:hypothetical protein